MRARLIDAGYELAVIQVGERRGGPTRTLRGLAGGAENVLRAGELEDVLGILQEAVQGTTLVEAAELRARGPAVPSLADAVAAARASANLEAPLVVGRALPCRVVDGAAGIFELEPSDPEITGHLGDVYWALGRREEARFKWRLALSLSEDAEEQAMLERRLLTGLTADEMPGSD